MKLINSVFQQIDRRWEEQRKFLQKIGRMPSTLGNEAPVQNVMQKTFEELGLKIDCITPDIDRLSKHPGYSPVEWSYAGRQVVIGKWPAHGPKTGKSLILQGHIDVVSPEPVRLWHYDPWGAHIDGQRMYGRGILDMKAGISAMVYAVRAIKELGIELCADLYLESVIEEECTGNGALATLLNGYTADGVLIPEPTGLKAYGAQVGVIWMRITIKGVGSHVSRPEQGINAIDKAYVLIEALKKYRQMINERPKHPMFEDSIAPLNVNVGMIRSGDWASTTPAECVMEVRIGLYPGQDPREIKKEVKSFLISEISKDCFLKENPPEISFFGFHAQGAVLVDDSDLFRVLARVHKKINDQEMDYVSSRGTTDARFYKLFYGIPATCYGPLGGNIHAPDEWVDLSSVKTCTKTLAAFILEWCGIEKKEV